mgnify:CR=1 FL=1
MPLSFFCPFCSARLLVADHMVGRQVQCPNCGERLLIPELSPPPSSSGPAEVPSSSSPVPRSLPPVPNLPEPTVIYQPVVVQPPLSSPFDFSEATSPTSRITITHRHSDSFGTAFGSSFGSALGGFLGSMVAVAIVLIVLLGLCLLTAVFSGLK